MVSHRINLFSFLFSFLNNRNYIKRYADILKGRLILELLYLPGVAEKRYELLGEKSLCIGLAFLQRVESLGRFAFLSRDLSVAVQRSLFTFGDLISSILNLGIQRVDIFFDQLTEMHPTERCRKLAEGTSLFRESLRLVRDHVPDADLHALIIQKMFSTQVSQALNFISQYFACLLSSLNVMVFAHRFLPT